MGIVARRGGKRLDGMQMVDCRDGKWLEGCGWWLEGISGWRRERGHTCWSLARPQQYWTRWVTAGPLPLRPRVLRPVLTLPRDGPLKYRDDGKLERDNE